MFKKVSFVKFDENNSGKPKFLFLSGSGDGPSVLMYINFSFEYLNFPQNIELPKSQVEGRKESAVTLEIPAAALQQVEHPMQSCSSGVTALKRFLICISKKTNRSNNEESN